MANEKLSREELEKQRKNMLESIPSEKEWNEGCFEMKLIDTALHYEAEAARLREGIAELKVYQKALWMVADEIEKRVGTEVFWGVGATETDIVTDVLKWARQDLTAPLKGKPAEGKEENG